MSLVATLAVSSPPSERNVVHRIRATLDSGRTLTCPVQAFDFQLAHMDLRDCRVRGNGAHELTVVVCRVIQCRPDVTNER